MNTTSGSYSYNNVMYVPLDKKMEFAIYVKVAVIDYGVTC